MEVEKSHLSQAILSFDFSQLPVELVEFIFTGKNLPLDFSQLAVEIEEVIFHMPFALNYLAEIHVK